MVDAFHVSTNFLTASATLPFTASVPLNHATVTDGHVVGYENAATRQSK